MRHLNQTVARMDRVLSEIDAEISQWTDKPTKSTTVAAVLTTERNPESKRALQEKIIELRALVNELRRPPLNEEDRRDVLNRIMDGLAGFGDAEAARLAASEYTSEWFENETDQELARLLAQALLKRYPSAGLGAPSVWANYAGNANV